MRTTKTFQLRGLPALLMLGVVLVVVLGILALVLMVGAAVAVAGLALSAGAALFYTLRRKLSPGTKQDIWLEPQAERPATSTALEVREIEVEVLPKEQR